MDLSKIFTGFFQSEVDEIVTVTCVADSAGNLASTYFQFFGIDYSGVQWGISVWYTVAGVGTRPAGVIYGSGLYGTSFYPVQVNVPLNATAAQVAAATTLALSQSNIPVANFAYVTTPATAPTTVVLTNIWSGAVNAPVQGTASTGFTLTVTQAGTAVLTSNMASNSSVATPGIYYIKCPLNQKLYISTIQFIVAGVTDMTKWGSLGAANTNGCLLRMEDCYAGTLNQYGGSGSTATSQTPQILIPAMLNNNALLSVGSGSSQVDKLGNLIVSWDPCLMFGPMPYAELVIDGTKGQRLAFVNQDNWTGLTMNAYATGHYYYTYAGNE